MTVSPQVNRVLVGGRTVDSFEVRTTPAVAEAFRGSSRVAGGGLQCGRLVVALRLNERVILRVRAARHVRGQPE